MNRIRSDFAWQGRLPPSRVRLGVWVVCSPPSSREVQPGVTRFLLEQPAAHVIGSSRSCDIVVPDRFVSRRHLKLTWGQDGLFLEDLRSTNGSFVAGTRIHGRRLASPPVLVRLGFRRFSVLEARGSPMGATAHMGDLVCGSPDFTTLFHRALIAAALDDHVIIAGPPGSGKTALAAAMHNVGSRRLTPVLLFSGIARMFLGEQAGAGNPEAKQLLETPGVDSRLSRLLWGRDVVVENQHSLDVAEQALLRQLLEWVEWKRNFEATDRRVAPRLLVTTGEPDSPLLTRMAAVRLPIPSHEPAELALLAWHFLGRMGKVLDENGMEHISSVMAGASPLDVYRVCVAASHRAETPVVGRRCLQQCAESAPGKNLTRHAASARPVQCAP